MSFGRTALVAGCAFFGGVVLTVAQTPRINEIAAPIS